MAPASAAGSTAVRTHDERARGRSHERVVDRAVGLVGVEAGPADVADHADDRRPRAGGAAAVAEAAAEDLLAGEEAPWPRRDRRRRRRPGASARRAAARARGVSPVAWKKPVETPTHGQTGWFWPAGVGRSSRSKLLLWPLSLGGRLSDSAALCTPGSAASRSTARFQNASRSAGSRIAGSRQRHGGREHAVPCRCRPARGSGDRGWRGPARRRRGAASPARTRRPTSARRTRRGVGASVDDRPPARSA